MSTEDVDLLEDCESIPPVTTRRLPHAAADGDTPLPAWAQRAQDLRRARGEGPITTGRVPVGMVPGNYGAAGMTASDFERAQMHAGALGANVVNKILRASYPAISMPMPADDAPQTSRHKGVLISLPLLWRALKSRLFGGKNDATG